MGAGWGQGSASLGACLQSWTRLIIYWLLMLFACACLACSSPCMVPKGDSLLPPSFYSINPLGTCDSVKRRTKFRQTQHCYPCQNLGPLSVWLVALKFACEMTHVHSVAIPADCPACIVFLAIKTLEKERGLGIFNGGGYSWVKKSWTHVLSSKINNP